MSDKNTILTYGEHKLYVLEETNVQDRIFLLVAEVTKDEEDITDNIFIVEKTITPASKIMIRQIEDKPTLSILNPIFENLISDGAHGGEL